MAAPDFTRYNAAEAEAEAAEEERREARLDLVVRGPTLPGEQVCDITVRNPGATTYLPHSAHIAGWALRQAARDKVGRYGMSVTCLAFESFGRWSGAVDDFLLLLDAAARDAATADLRRGAFRSRLDKWKLRLQIAAARCAAQAVRCAIRPCATGNKPGASHGASQSAGTLPAPAHAGAP